MYEQNDTSSQHTEADNRSSLCTANTMKVLSVSALLLWCQRHYQQISAKGGNCLKWAKISPQSPNLWFPFSSSSSRACEGYFACEPPPPLPPAPPFFIPQPSHPLSTPFAPTIPLSPHRPTLNRLLWNLFKYFDISPPLTSRAEMICDSWRWARSEELPPTPCLPSPPPPPPLFL